MPFTTVAIILGILAFIVFIKILLFKSPEIKPPETTPSDIHSAIAGVLKARTPGGFVVFSLSSMDYIQYASDSSGLMLNWSFVQSRGRDFLPLVEGYLTEKGWQKLNVSQFQAMEKGQYFILEDGLFASMGDNADEITTITRDLLKITFAPEDESQINIEYNPKG